MGRLLPWLGGLPLLYIAARILLDSAEPIFDLSGSGCRTLIGDFSNTWRLDALGALYAIWSMAGGAIMAQAANALYGREGRAFGRRCVYLSTAWGVVGGLVIRFDSLRALMLAVLGALLFVLAMVLSRVVMKRAPGARTLAGRRPWLSRMTLLLAPLLMLLTLGLLLAGPLANWSTVEFC